MNLFRSSRKSRETDDSIDDRDSEAPDDASVPDSDAAADPDSELIAVPARSVRTDRETCVVIRSEDGATESLSAVELGVLRALSIPCDTEQLEDRLAEQGWDNTALEDVPALVGELRERGLVVEFVDWIKRYPDAEPRPAPGISALAVPTKDRPEMLDRALAAWIENLHDRATPDIVIADESDRRSADVRAVAERHATAYAGRVYLLDAAFRARLAEKLPAEARFALGFPSGRGKDEGVVRTGVNRNTILLALAGRAAMSVDDDVLPVYREFDDADSGIVVNADLRPHDIVAAADLSECENLGVRSPRDGYALHAELLGRSCREVIGSGHARIESPVDPEFVARYLSESSRVAVVASGYWGDLGTSAPFYLLDARDRTDAEAFDEDRYEQCAESTAGMRGVPATSIGAGSFVGGQVSFDARSVLPPFSPRGRNQDGLWSVCLSALHPAGIAAYPSISIKHAPADARKPDRDALVRWNPRVNDLLILLVNSFRAGLRPGDDAYRVIGSGIAGLGSGPRGEFRAYLAELVAHAFAGRIAALEAQYGLFSGQPAAWGEDCIAAIEYARIQLEKPGFWLPADGPRDEDEFAGFVRSFGDAISAWPEAFAAAKAAAGELLDTVRVT